MFIHGPPQDDEKEEKIIHLLQSDLMEFGFVRLLFHLGAGFLLTEGPVLNFIITALEASPTKVKKINLWKINLDHHAMSKLCTALSQSKYSGALCFSIDLLSREAHQTLLNFIQKGEYAEGLVIELHYDRAGFLGEFKNIGDQLLSTLATGNSQPLALVLNEDFITRCSLPSSQALYDLLRYSRLQSLEFINPTINIAGMGVSIDGDSPHPAMLYALQENPTLIRFSYPGLSKDDYKVISKISKRNKKTKDQKFTSNDFDIKFKELFIKEINLIIYQYAYATPQTPAELAVLANVANDAFYSETIGIRDDGFKRFYSLVIEHELHDLVFYKRPDVKACFARNSERFFKTAVTVHHQVTSARATDKSYDLDDEFVSNVRQLIVAADMDLKSQANAFRSLRGGGSMEEKRSPEEKKECEMPLQHKLAQLQEQLIESTSARQADSSHPSSRGRSSCCFFNDTLGRLYELFISLIVSMARLSFHLQPFIFPPTLPYHLRP